MVNGKFPIQIVNKSNKFIRLKKGCVIGKISPVTPNQKTVNSVNHVTGSHKVRVTDEEFLQQVKVNEEHKMNVGSMLLRNRDVFAFHDMDLGTRIY